jgi:hypothetical protein
VARLILVVTGPPLATVPPIDAPAMDTAPVKFAGPPEKFKIVAFVDPMRDELKVDDVTM